MWHYVRLLFRNIPSAKILHSTIKNADNIVVLKEGAIVAEGTQEQLLESCPLYRDMWQAHIGAKNWAVSSAAKEA